MLCFEYNSAKTMECQDARDGCKRNEASAINFSNKPHVYSSDWKDIQSETN